MGGLRSSQPVAELQQALSHAVAFIMCVSQGYKHSANCRFEANHAHQLQAKGELKIVYVMMQEHYTTSSTPTQVDGWLGSMIADNAWYPGWTRDHVRASATLIAPRIGSIGRQGTTTKHATLSSSPAPGWVATTQQRTSEDHVALWLRRAGLACVIDSFRKLGIDWPALLFLSAMATRDRDSPARFEAWMALVFPSFPLGVRARLGHALLLPVELATDSPVTSVELC